MPGTALGVHASQRTGGAVRGRVRPSQRLTRIPVRYASNPVPLTRRMKRVGQGYRHSMDNEMSNGAQATRYLDLDGDGVPDAVEMIEVVSVDRTGDGSTDEVAVVEELATGIGIEGVPRRLTVVDEMTIALDE
jgi:hypothetical protein